MLLGLTIRPELVRRIGQRRFSTDRFQGEDLIVRENMNDLTFLRPKIDQDDCTIDRPSERVDGQNHLSGYWRTLFRVRRTAMF